MFMTPIEKVCTSVATTIDTSIGSSQTLNNSRLVSVILETGFAIGQPFIETALTVQHLCLAIINRLRQIAHPEEGRIVKLHLRHTFHHLVGVVLVSPLFFLRHVAVSLFLINPYFYAWARKNKGRLLFDLLNSWSVSQRLTANLISKPSYSEQKIKELFLEVRNKIQDRGNFQMGCFIETGISNSGETVYRMVDGQNERTWLIKGEMPSLEISEYNALFSSSHYYPSRY